jgi:hypothetical protein
LELALELVNDLLGHVSVLVTVEVAHGGLTLGEEAVLPMKEGAVGLQDGAGGIFYARRAGDRRALCQGV